MTEHRIDDMTREQLVELLREIAHQRDQAAELALRALDRWSKAARTEYEALLATCPPDEVAGWIALLEHALKEGWVTQTQEAEQNIRKKVMTLRTQQAHRVDDLPDAG